MLQWIDLKQDVYFCSYSRRHRVYFAQDINLKCATSMIKVRFSIDLYPGVLFFSIANDPKEDFIYIYIKNSKF